MLILVPVQFQTIIFLYTQNLVSLHLFYEAVFRLHPLLKTQKYMVTVVPGIAFNQ